MTMFRFGRVERALARGWREERRRRASAAGPGLPLLACGVLLAMAVGLGSTVSARAEAWFECHAASGKLCTFYIFKKGTNHELAELVLGAGQTDVVYNTSPGKGDRWCASLDNFFDPQGCDGSPVTDLNIFP